MANLKSIKSKILSYKKTGTVTHAMEAVSAVKMRKGQERALSGRSYAAAALSVLERLSGTADMSRHPLLRTHQTHAVTLTTEAITVTHTRKIKTCYIVVTSDKGLAGALNSGVIRNVEQDIKAKALSKDDVVIVAFGRRGGEHFQTRGYDVRIKQQNISDTVSESDIQEITHTIITWKLAAASPTEHIADARVNDFFLAYQNFISTFEQEPVVRQIVPITPEVIHTMVAGIRPARGKYAPKETSEMIVQPAAYTVEPDADSVLSVLLPRLLNIAIFHGLLESKASEHSARMVAMKSATDKAKEMAKGLTRTFNKVRQAAITREVSEITSGIEAMR